MTRIALGLGLLTKGADWFIAGAVALARLLRVPQYAIGATVVAMGTSLPELVTSAYAAWTGRPDIALGNVVGSNLFNVGVVFGVSALLCPLALERDVFGKDTPHYLLAAAMLFLVASDGRIDRLEGLLLLALGAVYTASLLSQDAGEEEAAVQTPTSGGWRIAGFLAAGGVGFTLGARWLVDGSTELARAAGIPEWIVGLTVVAAGTSLPELATSIAASRSGNSGIAVGNVIGSNVLNIYVVLGVAAAIAPLRIEKATLGFDIPALLFIGLPFLLTMHGKRVTREAGLMMLLAYAAALWGSLKLHPIG